MYPFKQLGGYVPSAVADWFDPPAGASESMLLKLTKNELIVLISAGVLSFLKIKLLVIEAS